MRPVGISRGRKLVAFAAVAAPVFAVKLDVKYRADESRSSPQKPLWSSAQQVDDEDSWRLQQKTLQSLQSQENGEGGKRDLVFTHIPYNFGHTIEKVAVFPTGASRVQVSVFMNEHLGGFGSHTERSDIEHLNKTLLSVMKDGGSLWGHFNAELQQLSETTGCSLYFTPPKYWPNDVAKRYFGNKTVFGILRDPYERLVAMFRGARQLNGLNQDYGTDFNQKYVDDCDVNSAIREMLEKYIAANNSFASSCTYIPQAEYFDGDYGITVPVDCLKFPESMNDIFRVRGYTDYLIATRDIFHVDGCPEVWSRDLDPYTRSLVQKVYARDFELLCKHFGRCGTTGNTCIHGVPHMCPTTECMGEERCAWEESALLSQTKPAGVTLQPFPEESDDAKALAIAAIAAIA